MSGMLRVFEWWVWILERFPVLPRAALITALTLPTLMLIRTQPQIVFWVEWLCAALLGLTLLAEHDCGPVQCDELFVVVALLVLGAALNAEGRPAGVGFSAYLALFLAARLVGRSGGPLVATVCLAMLMCGLFQSLLGALQLAGVAGGGFVLAKIYNQAFGNVGQANHYAALLSIALVAALPVFRTPLWRRGVTVWLAAAIASSASRAAWLYFVAFLVVGGMGVRARSAGARSAAKELIVVSVLAVAVQLALNYSGVFDEMGVTSSIARAADSGSNGQRLYDWSLALSAIKAHPWFGVGVGGFHGWAVEQMPLTPHVPFSKFAEHAHNLPLHLAATMGLPFAVLSLGVAGWWLFRQLRVPMTPDRLFALSGLSVIGLHSMVEYPLWYSYFIIPAGLFCGILSKTDPTARTVEVPAWAMRVLSALFVVGLVWVARDYVIVERAYADWSGQRSQTTDAGRVRIRAALSRIPDWSIVADHARALELQTWRPEPITAAGVAQQCDAAFKARPSWGLGTQCLLAKAMAGDRPGVERMSLVLCEGFPRHHQMLREWAEVADGYRPIVSVQSENCLRKQ